MVELGCDYIGLVPIADGQVESNYVGAKIGNGQEATFVGEEILLPSILL